MKKRLLLITIFFVVGLIIVFTIPISKSKNLKINLINSYMIKKESDTNIRLLKDDEIIINDYIAEFSYGKRYILLKCLDSKDLVIKFYIIDSNSDKIYGPFLDYQIFLDKQKEIVDEEVSEYIKTINYK